MTAVAIYAFAQREAAKDQRRDSQARALLAQSLNQLDIDPELSLLLGLRAAAIEQTRQVEDVLRRALEASRIRGVRETTLTDPVAPPRNGRARALGRVLPHHRALAVALSSDRRLAATGGQDRTARLWSARTGKQRQILRGHTLSVLAVAFSPDGRLLVTGSADGTARLWNTRDGGLVDVLVGHTNAVTSVAFNQRGDLLATGSRDRTVRVWDPRTAGISSPCGGIRTR